MKKITLEKLAAIVSEKLKEHDIDAILVGGSCVSIYSQNRYQSYDLDYVTYEDLKTIEKVLHKLDFKREGKYFSRPDCKYFIEFVSPPVAIGSEPIHDFENYKTKLGTIKMLTPTDCIKDRLASYYHWNDKQALDQAIMVFNKKQKIINLNEIKRWSKKEGFLKKFDFFLKETKKNTN